MSTRDHDLEAAIDKVKKEILAAGLQPQTPPSNEGKANMAAAKKKTTTEATAVRETKAPVEGYTVEQLATDLGSDSVTVRKGLRDLGATKPGTRWVWPKKTDPAVTELRAQLKEWLATDGRQGNGRKNAEATPAEKAQKASVDKPAAKKTTAKKTASAPAKKPAKKKVAASE